MELIKYPAESLLQKSIKVEDITDEIRQLALDMKEFMTKLPWGNPVGLAAPQIGKNIRMFIWLGEVVINPEIINKTKEEEYYLEGCYSLEENKTDYPIWRPKSIWVKYQDIEGKYHNQRLNGKRAEVFLHELDHLEGRLCCPPKSINNK